MRAFVLVFLALIGSAAAAGAERSVPAVSRVLDDGLTAILAEDHGEPVAALQIWVRAGSVFEGEKSGSGMSHLLEHLAFKGEEGRSDGEIPRAVQALGGDVNAFTSFDRTVFHVRLPSRNWEKGLELLVRLVFGIEIDPEMMETEKKVVLREIAMKMDEPDDRLSRLMWETAYLTHPYRLPVIGYPGLLEALTPGELESYYRRRYVPNNAVLVGAGDISPREFFEGAARIMKDIPRRDYPAEGIPEEPRQLCPRRASEAMDVDLARVAVAFHIPSIHDPDLYPLDVLALLAGRGRSSRLFRQVREKGIVYSVDAYSYTPYWPGLFVVEAVCEPERADEAEAAILKVLRSFAEEPVSAEELEKARLRVRSDYLHSLETAEGLAGDLGANYLLTGSLDFSRRYLEGIAGVGAEDVRRAAGEYLDPARATSVRILPEAAAAAVSSAPVAAPGPVTRQVLSNGLTLLLREDHTLPLIAVRAVFRGGVLAEDEETNGIGALTARLLDRGTSSRSAREIAEAMENFGGSLETYSARNSTGISLECPPDRFRETMALLGDLLTGCVFPPAEVEKEREALLAAIRSRDDTPEGMARDLLLEAVFPGAPYRLPLLGRARAVSGLTGEQLAAFYRRIYCGRNGVVAVFGDIDPAAARRVGEEFLGVLPPGAKLIPPEPEPPPSAPRRRRGEKPEARQEVVALGFPAPPLSSPDNYPLEALAAYLNGLASPLFLKVRAREGLAYYVGAYQILGLLPGSFVFYAGTVPGREGEVTAAVRAEVARIAEEGISEEDLHIVRERLLGRFLFDNETDSGLAFSCALDELYGLGYDRYLRYPARIEAVTPEDLKEVARKYLFGDDYGLAVVGPGRPPDTTESDALEEE